MKIAITGGIGSGKSYVCQELLRRGIKVYDCDAAAKRLMRTDEALRQALIQLVGNDVYQGETLQKPVLAKFLLESEANKLAVNDIVHPIVAQDFEKSGMDWLESAILFDSGFNQRTHFDRVVCVTAPLDIRVERVMSRDGISKEKALDWIHTQLPQDEVMKRSHFVILNDGKEDVPTQVEQCLHSFGYHK